jgi:TonB family protein
MRTLFFLSALLFSSMWMPVITLKAETSAGGHIVPQPRAQAAELPAGLTAPEPVGVHGCGGYPPTAMRARASGVTMVSFHITPEGKVEAPEISKSSGNDDLDRASVLCVASWLYKAATRDGVPVEVQWETGINWNAPAFATSEPEDQDNQVSVPVWARGGFRCEQWYAVGSQKPPHHAILTFSVGRDGSVKDVALTQSTGSDKIDADAIQCLQQRHYQSAKQHGEAIEYRLTETLY